MTDAPRAVLVTGAGRGIGRAIAQRLVNEGIDVLACDLEPDADGPGASAHALVASPYKAAHVSAKHGVLGLVKTLARTACSRRSSSRPRRSSG
jgi:NAD(P)-dependent dehydrogenase (short-subunit alcohol dehydrogenase family)